MRRATTSCHAVELVRWRDRVRVEMVFCHAAEMMRWPERQGDGLDGHAKEGREELWSDIKMRMRERIFHGGRSTEERIEALTPPKRNRKIVPGLAVLNG